MLIVLSSQGADDDDDDDYDVEDGWPGKEKQITSEGDNCLLIAADDGATYVNLPAAVHYFVQKKNSSVWLGESEVFNRTSNQLQREATTYPPIGTDRQTISGQGLANHTFIYSDLSKTNYRGRSITKNNRNQRNRTENGKLISVPFITE